MTGAGSVGLVQVSRLLCRDTPRNDGRAKGEAVSFVLNVLLPKESFFLMNPAKTR